MADGCSDSAAATQRRCQRAARAPLPLLCCIRLPRRAAAAVHSPPSNQPLAPLPGTTTQPSTHTGDGAKRRLEQNQKRLAALRAAALASTLVYAGARLALNRGGGSKGLHWAGLVVTLLAHGFAYLAIAAVARPTYSNSGALVDGGGDLDKGSASMYHDLL